MAAPAMVELRGAVSAVREGANGRLFLGSQDGFHLDLFTSGNPFPAAILNRWRATLVQRAREFKARGIRYVFFLVPDAPTVHCEDLPAGLKPFGQAPGQLFLDAMGEIPGITFVYPLQALRDARGGMEIYKKKDSHWTTYGSYVAYQEFMRCTAAQARGRTVPARDIRFTFRRTYGDLGSQTDPEQSEDIPVPVFTGAAPRIVASLEGAGRQTATETEMVLAQPSSRILFFRDSFMTDLSPYLARSYGNMLTLGSTTRVMFDAVGQWNPDVVVSQVAERKLLFLEPDHQQEGFEAIYHGDFRSPVGARLLRAILLRTTDAAAARALILDIDEDLKSHPVHAYYAALIMETACDIAGARGFIAASLGHNSNQASAQALAARIALAEGRMEQAALCASRAAELAPCNGYFHELHTYCLVQGQNLPAALAAAERGLDRVRDHPNLWYWASVCLATMGEAERAVRAIREAMALVPGNATYAQQCEIAMCC